MRFDVCVCVCVCVCATPIHFIQSNSVHYDTSPLYMFALQQCSDFTLRAAFPPSLLLLCVCVCVCVYVTPIQFKSCSNCKVQQLRPTTMRLNHMFHCTYAPSSGVRKPGSGCLLGNMQHVCMCVCV